MSGNGSGVNILGDVTAERCVKLQAERNWLAAKLCWEELWHRYGEELDRIDKEVWKRIEQYLRKRGG